MLIKPKITFSTDNTEYHFENLYIVEIEVKNDSSQDYSIFDLKMAVSAFAKIIYMDCNGQDASHEIILKDKIGFEKPCQIADIALNPFNRRNSYHISVYVTCNEGSELTKNDIKYSSKIPAIFSAVEPVTETIAHY
ncbi:MAG: hypothetical protein M3O71_26355 [Bacteroidota bacterium]|nr:hypothetical protein [Bacteroidota bacterium]